MAKDSIWSWFVLLGSFTAMFLENGIVKSLGVLLPVLREQFTTYTWVIGLAISLSPGFGAVTCIAATGLKKVSSNRFVLMLFGAISSFGLLVSSMASNVELFSMGLLLTGFSFGAEATAIAVIPVYFDKYFDISNSVAHFGLAVGVIVMPLFTQLALDVYGWRGTMLILCAINTNVVVAGALLKPELHHVQQTPQDKPHNNSDSKESLTSNIILDKHYKKKSTLTEIIAHIFDLKVFKNFELVSLLSVSFGTGVYYTGWLIYFVPHVESLGFSLYTASTLATVGGVGHLIGFCAFPCLAKLISSKTMIIISQLIAFMSLAIDPVLSLDPSYYGIMSASFALNFACAVFLCAETKQVLGIITKVDYYGYLNWAYVVYGVGSILSGYLTGWLFDKYGNYTLSYLFLSIVVLMSLLPMFMKCFCYHEKGTYTPISKEDQDAK